MDKYLSKLYQLEYAVAGRQIGMQTNRAVKLTFNCTDCCDDDCRDRATVTETAKARAIITATAITGVKAASSSPSTLKSAANGHIIEIM
uniref:Uncharacterized protein n=1 Tax=Glossina austeni TaxID=7395 RepID=A0A1A9VDY6_GLOAU